MEKCVSCSGDIVRDLKKLGKRNRYRCERCGVAYRRNEAGKLVCISIKKIRY